MTTELEIQKVKTMALQAQATANLTLAIKDLTKMIRSLKAELPENEK
jgi:hypothetical protein